MQNEWAGAQAFSSFDTYLAPFVKIDNLSYKEVKQALQSFIYGVNTPSRWGTQAPFTNITLDWVVPNDLAELNCIIGGKEVEDVVHFKYELYKYNVGDTVKIVIKRDGVNKTLEVKLKSSKEV